MSFSDLTEFVTPYAPGCPLAVAVQQLRFAARDLCRDTHCWRETLRVVVPAQTGEGSFNAAGKVVCVLGVTDGERVLQPGADYINTNETIFYTAPDGKLATLLVDVALEPGLSADGLPAALEDRHGELIAERALSRLVGQQSKPWSGDPMAHEVAYRRGVSRVKVDQAKGHNSAGLRMRIPAFGG